MRPAPRLGAAKSGTALLAVMGVLRAMSVRPLTEFVAAFFSQELVALADLGAREEPAARAALVAVVVPRS